MPTHMVLSSAEYLDQFCFIVSCAVASSARQDSLLRPRTIEPCPAASQLGPTWSVGGPPARPRLVLRVCRAGATFWLSCVGGRGLLFVGNIGGKVIQSWLPMSDRRLRYGLPCCRGWETA